VVRHLDTDRLLARDRRQDADLGRRQRVGEVVLQGRDLRHLRAGGELELVAGDPGTRDLADQVRIDAEVRERLDQGLPHARARLGLAAGGRLGTAQDTPVGERVHGFVAGLRHVEQRRLIVRLGLFRKNEKR